jgi:hypothetical protein
MPRKVLILGSGHLAYRLKKLVSRQGYEVISLSNGSRAAGDEESPFQVMQQQLRGVDLESLIMAYAVDDRDEQNLEFTITLLSLKPDLRITASLFNENIAPHLRAAHPNVAILNPAKIAAPVFIDALYAPVTHSLRYEPSKSAGTPGAGRRDVLMWALAASFAALMVCSAWYFHVHEHLSWLDSFYFVVVTVATVGYGDISLLNSSAGSKIMDIGLILGSTFFIWMIFSLTVDRIIKKRVQLALGRRRYSYKDHVILCGLGRLGYFIAEGLLERGEKLLIIEKDENSEAIEYFRARGAAVYIGDARSPRVLADAGVRRAKALVSVIDNDYTNLEVGLNARSFQPDLRLMLRIFDESMSEMVRENLDIHLSFSVSAIADGKFAETLGV